MASAGNVMLSPEPLRISGLPPALAVAVAEGRAAVVGAATDVGRTVVTAAGDAAPAGRGVGDACAETDPEPVESTESVTIKPSAIMAPPEMSNHLLSFEKRDAIAP